MGVIVATNNGGLADVQLYINPNATGSYSIVQGFKQSVEDRDLQILMKNLAIGTGSAPSFGGAYGSIFIANATTVPSSNPTGQFLLQIQLVVVFCIVKQVHLNIEARRGL